jgi:exosortase/archaeosortase family protein
MTRGILSKNTLPRFPNPIWLFTGKFVGCIIFFFALSLFPIWDRMLVVYLEGSALISNGLLHLLGENSQVSATTIWSVNYSINVAPGCSALELAIFFTAALLAFPSSVASWRQKLVGLAVGILALEVCNLFRIASLYWLGVHFPSVFNAAHFSIWPGILLFFTLFMCAGWLQWILPKVEQE